jgi:hypothetical protein
MYMESFLLKWKWCGGGIAILQWGICRWSICCMCKSSWQYTSLS